MNQIYIIQPWFTGKGHPAQSVLNTARALRDYTNINYIVSAEADNDQFDDYYQAIEELASCERFQVNESSMRSGTRSALLYLFKNRKRIADDIIFFFDMHLVTVAAFWVLLGSCINVKRLGLLYLKGPERIIHYSLIRLLVMKLLRDKKVILYLRTQELAEAWQNAFPEVLDDRIKVLPSLEIADLSDKFTEEESLEPIARAVRFGVIGQIRQGKGLAWLVPFFQNHPEAGELTVAGTFCDEQDRIALPQLITFPSFHDAFLSEKEMFECALSQNYLLLLYDDWDSRMESAVLYLAARVRRPVIAYDEGWCGRMIRQYHCGLLLSKTEANPAAIFDEVPDPGSDRYIEMVEGMCRFVQAHSGRPIADAFVKAIEE